MVRDDPLWREAQPLVCAALTDFLYRDELKFLTSNSTLYVTAPRPSVLMLAKDRLYPAFEEAGWKSRSEKPGIWPRRLAFTHPLPQPVSPTHGRPNLRVVR